MLTPEHQKRALDHLNEICPDTFDEGENGPWKFTSLSREGSTWTLAFQNAAGSDSVRFEFDGDCVDETGIVADWFERINARIAEWEALDYE